MLPVDHAGASLVGRVWNPAASGPCLVTVSDGVVYDITTSRAPTMRDLLEQDDPAGYAQDHRGTALGDIDDIAANSHDHRGDSGRVHFLAPCDLQAVKACGVTFAQSMVERVIEEKAKGDASRAEAIRQHCLDLIGTSLTEVKAGSSEAEAVKQALIGMDMWSPYLEVGIGPDAEVFTKAQPMSPVGWGAEVGLHPVSEWNNPEPEIVLAVNSRGIVKGVTLGNDVNLRDVEGRSALLLGKAKDNNASCALGPFIRLFDDTYGIDDAREAELTLDVTGEDGFELRGSSSMTQISRDPLDLVAQTCGAHHQYPDGFCLFLGTMFAPVQDRRAPGAGFTHEIGDMVRIHEARLGSLLNRVNLSPACPPWTFGAAALMRNLAERGLI
ncbi:MAG: fumarylacetoacetate hydrolase [Alphaproteobacteria bacterium]|nr:fumarylacetoacetate hydrolase [Alphaproteobacteria bacterium]